MGKPKISIMLEVPDFKEKNTELTLHTLAHLSEVLGPFPLFIPYEFLIFTPQKGHGNEEEEMKFTHDVLKLQKRRKLKYEMKFLGASPKNLLKILSMSTGDLLMSWPHDLSIHSSCLLDAYHFYLKEGHPFIFGEKFHPESRFINFDDHQILIYKEKIMKFFSHETCFTLCQTKALKDFISQHPQDSHEHLKSILNKMKKNNQLEGKYKILGVDWIYSKYV